MAILVTGAAGFIGFHVTRVLLARGERVIGVDNVNDYYDPALKVRRLEQLATNPAFTLHRLNIADRPAMGADGLVPAAELLLLDPASLTQLKAMQ